MELNQMNKALVIYEKIKKLDGEVIELEKLAIQLANDDTEVCIEFKVTNFTKNKEAENNLLFDADEIPKRTKDIQIYSFDSFKFNVIPYPSTQRDNTSKNTQTLNHSVSTYTALNICGIILQDKLSKRQNLINKLSEMGVNI